MLDGNTGNFGAKKAKKHGFDWQQGYGGGALVKAPKEKSGKMGESGEKWGEMGENGENCGKFWMLDGIMGNLGAEKVKKHGFDWQQGYGGGGCIGESTQGKMGENGGKWGKMGKPNQSTLASQFLLFAPTSPHNTPFPPISSHFPLIFPHFPPFPPISPHFSWYWVHFGYVAGYITIHLFQVFLRPAQPCAHVVRKRA